MAKGRDATGEYSNRCPYTIDAFTGETDPPRRRPRYRNREPGVGFQAGSDTSQAAAEQVKESAVRQRMRVSGWVYGQGLHGATCDEACAALGLPSQSGSARFTELKQDGILVPTQETRKTRQGGKARVLIHREYANDAVG